MRDSDGYRTSTLFEEGMISRPDRVKMWIWIALVIVLLIYLFFEEYRSYSDDDRNPVRRFEQPADLRLISRLSSVGRYVMWRQAMIVACVLVLVLLLGFGNSVPRDRHGLVFGVFFGIFSFKYFLDTLSRFMRITNDIETTIQTVRRSVDQN